MQSYSVSGTEIRKRRELCGKGVKSLAAELGITPDYLYKIEAGRKQPGPELAGRLIKALDAAATSRIYALVAAVAPITVPGEPAPQADGNLVGD